MKVPAPRIVSTLPADQSADSRLPRRRLIVLLAASAGGALAALAACGGEKELTRDKYSFPGAEKDASGKYKMQSFR